MDETGLVNLAISHSVLSISNEKRFERSMTIGTLKEKLYRLTGTHPASMELELWDDGGAKVADMLDDDATLASFAPYDYCRVHVVDTNPAELAALTDVSQIEKYVMPDEKYDKLGESYRRWKKLNIPGAADERSKPRADDPYAGLDLSTIAHVTVGSRCLVRPAPNKPAAEMRGVVRYLGPTLFAAGYWVGIQLDEPMGLHDGEVKGERYFQCGPKYGTFVRPGRVECGDFPEESLLSDEDI